MITISGIKLYGTKDIATERGCAHITVRVTVRRLRHEGKLPTGQGRGRNDLFNARQKQLIIDNIGQTRKLYGKYSARNKK